MGGELAEGRAALRVGVMLPASHFEAAHFGRPDSCFMTSRAEHIIEEYRVVESGSVDLLSRRRRHDSRRAACRHAPSIGCTKKVSSPYLSSHMRVRDPSCVNLAVGQHVLCMEAEYVHSASHAGGVRVENAAFAWFKTWWRPATRTILGVMAFIALVMLALGGPATARGVMPALGIRWVAALIAVGASLMLLRVGKLPKENPRYASAIGQPIASSPTIPEIKRAMREAAKKYSPEVLDLFSLILQDSSRYMTRVSEQIELRRGCLGQEVIMDFALNDETVEVIQGSHEQMILVPLMRLKKGAVLDNLKLYNSEDHHVSALLREEVYGLLAYVISNLFRLAYVPDSPGEAPRGLVRVEDGLLWSLIQLVCHPECASEKEKAGILGLLGIASSDEQDAIQHLRDFCEFFADNYLIVVEAELPSGSRMSMKYFRTLPVYGLTATWIDRLRVRLGLSPFRFTVPLTRAFDAPSYHFSMMGVHGQYLANQVLIDSPSGQVIRQERFANVSPRPYLAAKYDSGLPYAHFYARGLCRSTEVVNMWTRVEFDEIPPGALGGAAVVSAACAVLIWFFTLIQPGLRSGQQITTDLPALLLAVPAFAATWIGQSAERVQRSSVATYIGLAVSAGVSLASALLYIANANHRSFYTIGNVAFLHGLVRLKDVDVSWLVLALVASIMSAYLVETLRDRVRNYIKLLRNGTSLDSS